MVNVSNQKRVPKLRFPGFMGEWKKSTLKREAAINPKSLFLPPMFSYIDLESVSNGILLKELWVSKDNAPSRAQRLLKKYDILFQTVRPYQRNNLFFQKEGDYVASTGYAQIRSKADPNYLYQFLHTTPFVNTVVRWSTGTSYPAISPSDLVKIPIYFPTLPEQQKIAAFLSAVDDKIRLLTRKKELLQQYKKGVMQKIFSREIRFKDDDGEDYPEWEEKRLGDVTEINPNNPPLPEKFIYIDLESVANGTLLKKLHLEKSNTPSRAQRVLRKGDILFQTVRPYQKNNFYFDLEGNYVASTGYAQIRTKGDNSYLYQFLHYQEFVNKVISRSTGSNYPAINPSDLREITIHIPSLLEQKKIGKFLLSIDGKIRETQTQIIKVIKPVVIICSTAAYFIEFKKKSQFILPKMKITPELEA